MEYPQVCWREDRVRHLFLHHGVEAILQTPLNLNVHLEGDSKYTSDWEEYFEEKTLSCPVGYHTASHRSSAHESDFGQKPTKDSRYRAYYRRVHSFSEAISICFDFLALALWIEKKLDRYDRLFTCLYQTYFPGELPSVLTGDTDDDDDRASDDDLRDDEDTYDEDIGNERYTLLYMETHGSILSLIQYGV
ncbi:hypothetical protein M9H77_23408 [Catharanthus roseus]|uniref:Uncharacterized protein n=1 Tax=Catharanthus roseus TaxID=4058 RepID=A0ACC0AUZ1_CATRO|nr:hypothetical protein M9H77_23408 [Catharanthus roseus]